MSGLKKLISAVSITLTASMAFTFPVQVFAQNLPTFSGSEENGSEATIVGELISEREEYTKYFKMSDGSTMAAQYEYPVHYKNDENQWTEYDNSLSESENKTSTDDEAQTIDDEKTLTNQKSNINVKLSNKAKLNNMIKVNFNDYQVSWGYEVEISLHLTETANIA